MERRHLLAGLAAGLSTLLALTSRVLGGRMDTEVKDAGATVESQSPSTATAQASAYALLDRFAAAWNAHDVDGLMACMAPECAFETAAGEDVHGTRHVGAEAVRRAYAAVFETYTDARWQRPAHFVAGDRAVSEWTFAGTLKDGTKVEVNGCDIFTLKDGKIALKNSYRKQRS